MKTDAYDLRPADLTSAERRAFAYVEHQFDEQRQALRFERWCAVIVIVAGLGFAFAGLFVLAAFVGATGIAYYADVASRKLSMQNAEITGEMLLSLTAKHDRLEKLVTELEARLQ